ncbi:MAG: hypothetical protein JWQ47_1224 [Glaciihabitans sp.]|nr:hypothetical protein [Glaciihabitans sp.]
MPVVAAATAVEPSEVTPGPSEAAAQSAAAAPRPGDTVIIGSFDLELLAAAAPAAAAAGEKPAVPETPVVPVQHFDPFPWGERPAANPVPDAEAEDDDFEQTLIVPRRDSGERFVLQFSTGESVTVSGSGLVGRNPMPQPGEFFDYLVSISDPGKSVSKTHLEFGQDAGAFWVSDRFSGNGSVVREPGMPPKRLGAGKRFRIVRGSRVDIGEQFFVVS